MTASARPPALLVPLLVVGLLIAGCTSGSTQSSSPEATDPTSSTSPEQAPDQAPEQAPEQAPDRAPEGESGTTACDEVVAGIDAFNVGDFEETVAAFERALPLAEAEDAAADTRASSDLLEAVQYYADLAPEDYLPASVSSPDFATYKAITLGQCAVDGPSPSEEEGGVLA